MTASLKPGEPQALLAHRILLAGLLDVILRACALAVMVFGKDREGIELRLRGGVLKSWRTRLRVGRNVRIIGRACRFKIGENVSIYGNAYFNANGVDGEISIGHGCHIDQFCVLHGQGGLFIGHNCSISSGVLIYTQTNQDLLTDGTPPCLQPVRYARVVLGDGCLVGAGARILPGVTIGKNCIVGAGAVVTRDVPDGQVVAGIPARQLLLHEDLDQHRH